MEVMTYYWGPPIAGNRLIPLLYTTYQQLNGDSQHQQQPYRTFVDKGLRERLHMQPDHSEEGSRVLSLLDYARAVGGFLCLNNLVKPIWWILRIPLALLCFLLLPFAYIRHSYGLTTVQ